MPTSSDRHELEDAVDDLFLRTHKRCYLGVVRAGVIEITVVRGRQGIARMPGLGTQITDNAHALAMGKVVLARLRPAALARYIGSGLTRYTPSTITVARRSSRASCATCAPTATRSSARSSTWTSAASRRRSSTSTAGSPAILGLSASTRAFDAEHGELAAAVRDLAAEAGPSADRGQPR